MKNRGKGNILSLAMLLFGIAAMLLRAQLYVSAVDAKGLLVRNTPAEMMLLALTAAVAVALLMVLKNDRGSNRYEDNYRASVPAGLGHVAAAVGMYMLARGTHFAMAGYLALIWKFLGLAAPVCLVLAGIARIAGKKPFFLLHVVPCVFLLLYLVGSYRLWSSNPQMQDYLFTLLATLSLALFAHFTAAFEADLGNRKLVQFSGLAAVYFCLAELGRTACPGLFFGGMFWALTGMCSAVSVREEKED